MDTSSPVLERAQTNPESTLPTHVPARRQSFHRARSAPGNNLGPVVTAHFIDDYGAHHYNPDEHDDSDHDDSEPTSPSTLNEKPSRSDTLDRHGTQTSDATSTDLERGRAQSQQQLSREKSTLSRRSTKDPFLVRFTPDDPENPKLWSFRRRWGATAIVSIFTFISPTSSSMSAPAVGKIGADFGVTNETTLSLLISIFVLAYAIGPLFLGPLSEIYGRRIVLQLSNLFFLAFNIGCGFATSSGQLIAFRFLSGLGGSAPLAIGGGVLSDCWDAEHRGQAVGLYSLMPLLGPAVGPVAGGWIAQKTTWRWCFWSTSILTVLIQVLGVIYLRETFGPVILAKRAAKLRKETGDQRWHTEWSGPGTDRTLSKVLRVSLQRPFRLLATQPIIQVLAIYMAFIYG
jgi:multidrug resistance protein